MDKKSQRSVMKAVLAGITDKDSQSRAIADVLKNLRLPDGGICIYNALPSEVNTEEIIEFFLQSRDVFLPVVKGEDIMLVKIDGNTRYVEGKWGILEPVGDLLAPEAARPSVTVTPLLGADRRLHRLGKGKGYYDRYFAKLQTYKVGLAFKEQVIEEIVCDEWDKSLDMLITPDGAVKREDVR